MTKKTRILDVVYNASNNELVRTKTLVKNTIVLIDATPFRTWLEAHYHSKVGETKASAAAAAAPGAEAEAAKKESRVVKRKYETRRSEMKIDPHVIEQFGTGRLYACLSSRPGQSGRADGYVLEGPELEFYTRKIALKKSGKKA